jgi:chromosome segregation and condensation protein ScpB
MKNKKIVFQILDAILLSSRGKIKIETLENFFKGLKIKNILEELNLRYKNLGFFVYQENGFIELVNRPAVYPYLVNFFDFSEEENSKNILEVLAIIAYAGPMRLEKINSLRNKNSWFEIFYLLKEGLVIKTSKNFFKVSQDFLDFFGFKEIKDLPDYFRVRKGLKSLI